MGLLSCASFGEGLGGRIGIHVICFLLKLYLGGEQLYCIFFTLLVIDVA